MFYTSYERSQKNIPIKICTDLPLHPSLQFLQQKQPLRLSLDFQTMSLLIKDTTKEEREEIVAKSIGNISGACDGCSVGIIEMYQDYIDGKKELRQINMEFHAGYISEGRR